MALRCFQKDEILNCDGYLPIADENYGFANTEEVSNFD